MWRISGLLGLLISGAAKAEEAAAAPTVNSGDTAWMLVSAAMVMLMTPGLAFFYAGMVRSKNAVATMMHSMIALPVVTICWIFFGYSLAFGPNSGAWIGNLSWAFLNGVGGAPNTDYGATIPHSLFMVFQLMFAIVTPALVSGAFAERIKFKSYLAFLVLWSLFIYSPLCHWVWGMGGYLRTAGILDFAGGLVVHLSAGASALAAAMVFGKRKDYGKADYSAHNVPLVVIGTGLLWFGWFAFNGGSAIGSGELATTAFVNTHIAGCTAMLAWVVLDWILKGKPSLVGACIGAVVGLITITPASGFVTANSAIIIGILGGIAGNLVAFARSKTQLDDSLDVFACHGVGGALGILLTGFMASKAVNAAGADASGALVATQLKGIALTFVFCFVGTFVILKAIDLVFGLRPDANDEEAGLDKSEHGEKSYQQ